jgi:acetyl-CoA carboxylase carboxyltransferase component
MIEQVRMLERGVVRSRTGARERVLSLCDPGSFVELGPARRARPSSYQGKEPRDGDGVVVGWGHVCGRALAVVCHDFSYAGGSIGAVFADKVNRVQRLAIDRRMPIVFLNDSGGARIHEGIEALHGCGSIMALNVEARRVIPQLSVILGPCAGAAAYSPALTDWTIIARGTGQMFLTGPEVVRAATGERVDPESLGGAALHTRDSGVAHLDAASEDEAIALARRLRCRRSFRAAPAVRSTCVRCSRGSWTRASCSRSARPSRRASSPGSRGWMACPWASWRVSRRAAAGSSMRRVR